MTDRELLERAARAAGWDRFVWDQQGRHQAWKNLHGYSIWNPLDDDGDALRLAVKLQLTIANEHVSCGQAYCTHGPDADMLTPVISGSNESEVIPEDYAATRRAIVLAAAALVAV